MRARRVAPKMRAGFSKGARTRTLVLALAMLALCLSVPHAPAGPTRDFAFERSRPEYVKLVEVVSPRVQEAELGEDYYLAATLSEKLLSDYEGATRYLKTYMDQRGHLKNAEVYLAAQMLARCYAHAGEFAEADKWLDKSQEMLSREFWYRKTKDDIERCRHWLPILEERVKAYGEGRSADKYRDIIRAYIQLDEYGHALASVRQMVNDFPNALWLTTPEFSYCRDFLASYVTAKKPPEEAPPPEVVEKSNPQVRRLFEALHQVESDRKQSCRKKWDSMSVVEKAKLVNRVWSCQPVKGFDWEPREEEAREFLRQQQSSFERSRPQETWDDVMVGHVGLAEEEQRAFKARESEVIDSIATIGAEAIPDLVAALESSAGREPGWASVALSRMGSKALPALGAEFERASQARDGNLEAYRTLAGIVRTVADMNEAATLPMLSRALKIPDRDVQTAAMQGLDRIKGGLTEDLLLPIWQSEGPRNGGEQALDYLGRYGTDRTIRALERDLPTAYVEAAYRIRNAIWSIKKRLGQDPGPSPEYPAGSQKHDVSALWSGLEKSLQSPNPGMRIEALERLGRQTEAASDLESFLAMARGDPVPAVRTAALEAASEAFARIARERSPGQETAPGLGRVFHQFIQIAMDGDDATKATIVRAACAYRGHEDESHFPRLCELIVEGMQSDTIEYRANAILAFTDVFRGRDDLIERYVSGRRTRRTIERIILDGLDSDYGRLKVDAIEAAGILRMSAARDRLIQIALKDKPHLRQSALLVLGIVGDSSCIPVLIEIAKSDPQVDQWGLYCNREQAWQAIKSLSEKEHTLWNIQNRVARTP